MKSARLFLAGMYSYPIICELILWLCIICMDPAVDEFWIFGPFIVTYFFGFFYTIMIVLIITFGVICMDMANKAYRQGEYEKIKHGWLLLKYAAIPYYVINFIFTRFILMWDKLDWSDNIWFKIIRILILLHPVIISCMMVFQSGYIGWCYIKYLKKQPEFADTKMPVHYFMQVIMGLDVISTILLCHKEKKLIISK